MKTWPINLTIKAPRVQAGELSIAGEEFLPGELVQVVRARNTIAAVNTGTASVAVPAIAGRSFCVLDARMRAVGGNVTGPTTVEIAEETSGKVFLSHVTADLTTGVWHDTGSGTAVITGITGGGLVVAGKKLLVTRTGGAVITGATHIDTIVVGYWTTV